MFSSVDLPQPEGPMMATNSPSLISKLTPFSAVVSISSVRKTLQRLDTLIIMSCYLIIYSFFNDSTGLALAALKLWSVTTAKVMAATASSATRKIHTGTGAW